MIIKLWKYNEIGELLIRNRTTVSQAQVGYRDGDQRVSVTRAAVCIEEKGTGMQTRYRGTFNRPPSQDLDQGCVLLLWRN